MKTEKEKQFNTCKKCGYFNCYIIKDYSAAAGNAVDMIFHIKSTVKTGFKSIGAK